MLLASNLTISVIDDQTALGQPNSTCIFVDSTAEKISKLCAYFFTLLGSIFGNILIIIIVYKNRELQKAINYFVVNMAVSDLLLSLVLFPIQITRLSTGSVHWHVSGILGSIFCKFHFLAQLVSLSVSVQSLVWIAIDRYVAVVFPIKLGLISSKIRTVAIVSTWIFAGLFYFPVLVTSGLVESGNNTFCILVSKQSIFLHEGDLDGPYYWLHLTLRHFAPLFLITVLYTAIAITLKRRKKSLADTMPNASEQRYLKKRRQATQMAIVILVLFYICIIPYTLSRLEKFIWRPSCAFLRPFTFIAYFMLHFSTVVNPIICLSFVESYRRGLKNIMCYFCGMQNNKRAKRERITLKRIRNLSGENFERTSKDSDNFQETFDTVQ